MKKVTKQRVTGTQTFGQHQEQEQMTAVARVEESAVRGDERKGTVVKESKTRMMTPGSFTTGDVAMTSNSGSDSPKPPPFIDEEEEAREEERLSLATGTSN